MIKIAVSGACGKMGKRIISLIQEDEGLCLTCALEHKDYQKLGQKIASLEITDQVDKIKDCDVVIDFTNPESTINHLDYCLKYNKAMVIGTTGLSQDQIQKIKDASLNVGIVFSPNMSVGVNVLFDLVRSASAKLGNDYCIKITESHHIHKKDAPSGTAKKIAEIIEQESCKVEDIDSVREGQIVGDHKIIFDSPLDRLELFHSAKTRDIFARGAIKAAKWIFGKEKGFYTMQDVLSLTKVRS